MSEVLGDTAWLHSTSADIKIVVSVSGTARSGQFRLSDRPEVKKYTDSRALARISGPIVVDVRGPASASTSTTSCVVIAPHDLTSWPDTVNDVAKAPLSQDGVSSLYLAHKSASLGFHDAINTTLKPPPLTGRHPAVVWAYKVEGGAATDVIRIEVSFKLDLAGVDYVSPW